MRKHLNVGGRRLAYLERDAPDADLTLVLLHAFPFSADMWAPQFAGLPRSWRLIAPDFRGFGESDADLADLDPADLSLEDYAQDVLLLLDHLDVREVILAGLSLGGYVVFALLRVMGLGADPAASRDRIGWPSVSGLVLADTRAQADTPEGRIGRQQMIARVDRLGNAGVEIDAMLHKLVGSETSRVRPDVVDALRAAVQAASPAAINAALRRMLARPDSLPLLARIDCPTLIVVGDEDALTPLEFSRDMQRHLPQATLEVIPAAGHMTNLERPDAFNAALTAFLSRLQAA